MSQVRVITGYHLDRHPDGGDWVLTEVVHLFDRPLLPDTMQRVDTTLEVADTLSEAIAALLQSASRAGLT